MDVDARIQLFAATNKYIRQILQAVERKFPNQTITAVEQQLQLSGADRQLQEAPLVLWRLQQQLGRHDPKYMAKRGVQTGKPKAQPKPDLFGLKRSRGEPTRIQAVELEHSN